MSSFGLGLVLSSGESLVPPAALCSVGSLRPLSFLYFISFLPALLL